MIKAVFIDVDNTLLDFNECAKIAMKTILNENAVCFEEHMFDAFVTINDSLWRDIEKGILTKEGLYEIRWNRIFKHLNINLDGQAFEQRFICLLRECAVPVPYAKEILEYLSSKYTVCVASNASHEQQLLRLKKAGMLDFIDKVFTSEVLGYSKPSKEFFDGCFNYLNDIHPAEVIMIGDSITADIRGGITYGMKTCWFNYKSEKLPDDVKPDFVVNSLSEIKDIL